MATVLVADDDLSVRTVMTLVLKRLGHEVLEAADGEDALALAREHLVELVLTDLLMPRRTGLELAKALASEPRLAQIPVILASATDADLAAADAGCLFLSKPFHVHELERVVAEALGPHDSVAA